MQALPNDRWRRFARAVIALGRNGIENATLAAEEAGFTNTYGGMRVRAHALMHDARMQAALLEESKKRINAAAAICATPVAISIALDERLKPADRLRACEMLFNRGGMPAMTEHKVTVEHVDDTRMLEFANRLASELGVDRGKLIGFNAKVIEGEKAE